MENFSSISEKEAKLVNGGSIIEGIELFGVCVAIFYAGWECGRGLAREVKSWF